MTQDDAERALLAERMLSEQEERRRVAELLHDGPIQQLSAISQMLDAGIATRRGVMNAHRERAYPTGTWRAVGGLSQSEDAQDTTVILPLFHQLTEEDQDRIVDTLARVIRDI